MPDRSDSHPTHSAAAPLEPRDSSRADRPGPGVAQHGITATAENLSKPPCSTKSAQSQRDATMCRQGTYSRFPPPASARTSLQDVPKRAAFDTKRAQMRTRDPALPSRRDSCARRRTRSVRGEPPGLSRPNSCARPRTQ